MKNNNKNMRNLILLIFILLFDNCEAQDNCEIKLRYVDLEIMTPINVDCANFETLFKSQIKTVIVSKKYDIDSLLVMINQLEIDTSCNIPDVRVKIEIISLNKFRTYCLSKMGIYDEYNTYILPESFLIILKKYMK